MTFLNIRKLLKKKNRNLLKIILSIQRMMNLLALGENI